MACIDDAKKEGTETRRVLERTGLLPQLEMLRRQVQRLMFNGVQ